MQTVRFSKVVEKCGRPETHLLLTDPAKDRVLQAAIKAQRVMTVVQVTVGTKTDHGEIGFHPGPTRQFLIFPKSLRAFAGRTVVGIKYDLLSSPELPKSQRAAPPRPAKKPRRKPKTAPKPASRKKPKAAAPPPRKVVPFQPASDKDEEDDEIAALKNQVRHAMKVLEDGKPVAAFNLLKRIVGE